MYAYIRAPRQFNILAYKCKQIINKIKYFKKLSHLLPEKYKFPHTRTRFIRLFSRFSAHGRADMLIFLDKRGKE